MVDRTKTAKSFRDKTVRQFTVFLENKVGRLHDLAKLLGSHHIHICALNVIEMADAAIARIIVSDPDEARNVFNETAVAHSECVVLAVELPEGAEGLDKVFSALLEAEINIKFGYSMMIRPHDKAVLALCVEDEDLALDVLRQHDYNVLGQSDISR
ncbi:MAG: acetolactate synthase [Verrucomicrobiae bacterium]|nr:acetolactate synthase [Verrucomicrobiae bacterium]